ncbi:PfaD family polyunsaturated fatty acid/polyketide biosynthesis protein [uncultured Thermanaerothrix sp.]|uniref:PfaD family polyunsaturated fatty acid/polyketide biosynthesis protein n=1 Tax=uncultured Thermanaerothrix sp. TaxID=1195149 RepID=UPI00260DD64B|nr:PfaD family polyunsaturated fatty acid/polyketide biosynthesis protein [uncultured Thermanaerothrix sp.]
MPNHNSVSSTTKPITANPPFAAWRWQGDPHSVARDETSQQQLLLHLEQPIWAITDQQGLGLSSEAALVSKDLADPESAEVLAYAPPLSPETLGNPDFRARFGLRYAYYAGAMAGGIASEDLVIALGKAGFMGAFGAAGLLPTRIEQAIQRIREALPEGPYAFNLIFSPNEPALEERTTHLYLAQGIRTIEASAYVDLTLNLVRYRLAGLIQTPQGEIVTQNRIIAKISRREVAQRFMQPAPADLIAQLLQSGQISETQANLAQYVPMADAITVEADSGGHTDNRPLVGLIPTMLALRERIQAQYRYSQPIFVGAAGGIGTPEAALAAFIMGADYIVTGSINQSCVEAGTSPHVKRLLAQADMADVMMAPAADMFEMGVKVQLLKRGTLFPLRAQKLYELYSRYPSLEALPAEEREKLERQIFKRDLESIWQETVQYFQERDPRQIERAQRDPHQRMALVFRWYLGLSSRWANRGEPGREMDYQIWCGPAMGTFNAWVQGTYLEAPESRRVADVALHLMTGCAYLARIRMLALQGVRLSSALARYIPQQPML